MLLLSCTIYIGNFYLLLPFSILNLPNEMGWHDAWSITSTFDSWNSSSLFSSNLYLYRPPKIDAVANLS